jgi:hypothetical protein
VRWMWTGLAAAAIVGASCPAAARMPASLFLKKADSLRARGPLALFSSDLKTLQFEAEAAGDELHLEHAERMASHQSTDWCAPVAKYLGPRELIEGMHALPRADLDRMDIKQAMRAVFARDYPCPR